jgi:hypothetical protein
MKNREFFKYLRNVILTAALAFPPISGSAASLTNNQGVVYENVTVISATPKDLLITYSSKGRNSAASIPLKSLPPDMQRQYGYSQGKEDAYKAEMTGGDAPKPQIQVQSKVTQPKAPAEPSPSLPKERQYGSDHPLYFRVVFGKEGKPSMLGVIDESNGPGSGYDTVYMDENMNNDFTDDQPKKFDLKVTKKNQDGSTTNVLYPRIEFKGPLGANESAAYSLTILALEGANSRTLASGSITPMSYFWGLDINDWLYTFLYGKIVFASSAAEALKSTPVWVGAGCKWTLTSQVSEGKMHISATLKDDSGCTARLIGHGPGKEISPTLTLSQSGAVILKKTMEFG